MRNKYNTSPKDQRTHEGIVFDSKLEMNYYKRLLLLKNATMKELKVVDIKMQYVFQLSVNEKKVCKYVCDFVVTYADGRIEYIDVKGFKTAIYRLKKKFVEAQFGIEIIEITKV